MKTKPNHARCFAAAVTASAALAGLISHPVGAAVITFDEPSGVLTPGYGGLNWSNIGRTLYTSSALLDSGYHRGNVSPDYVAYNSYGNDATVSIASGTFDFNGMYVTAAWDHGLTVNLEGLLAGTVIHSQTLVIDDDAPTYTNSNFTGIDTLRISTIAGTDAGTSGAGKQIAIDNLTINQVPEPSSSALLSIGVMSVILRRKRRSQSS